MASDDWKDRINDGREVLSATAREAASQARSRLEASYGTARRRATEWSREGRDLAGQGLEAGSKAAARSKVAVDKALFQSRDFVSDRPLAAVALGVAAGVLLGFVANRALKSKAVEEESEEDNFAE